MRRRLAQLLLAAAAVAALLAVWAWLTGGFRVRVLGVPLSVRGEHRAAFVAIILGAIGFFLHTGLRHRVSALRVGLALPPFERMLFPSVLLAAAAVLGAGLAYGSRAAGGADPYGYVSQADLWRKGDLRIHQPFVASVPWPDAEWTFSPLGYKPAADHTIVPTYAPGYPLLMALLATVLGEAGKYYVAPICGAALVLLTYALGARLSGRVVGTIAALCLACSPTVLFMTLSAMSDVPVAAFWAAAILLANRRTTPGALASALAAGIAIVIRPNLVFAAIVPFLLVAWPSPNRAFGAVIRRAAVFTIACAPFPLFIGWLFNELYGSPLRSGYGANDALFGLENVRANLATYPSWLLETQGPLVFLFLLSPFVALRARAQPPLRWMFAAFAALIIGSYFVYLPFDAWWYLRFLLPAFPFIFILAADTVWTGTRGLARDKRNLVVVLFSLVMLFYGTSNSIDRHVIAVGHGEEKYIEVARYVDHTLPSNAVVYSLQHSGSIRYYSGRLTLRWDYLPPDWLDRSIQYLQQTGYEPFLLLDDWEVPMFSERFASQKHVSVVAEEPEHKPCTHTTYLYRVVPGSGQPSSERIPQILGCE